MRKLVIAILMLPALASAQGLTYSPRTIRSPRDAWGNGPVIPEPPGTVSHAYWNGTGLVETKAVTWTQVGTVPQVQALATSIKRPGAGNFSDANNYTLPVSSVTDFTGDFSACLVVVPSTTAAAYVVASDGSGSNGWFLRQNAGGTVDAIAWSGALVPTTATGTVTVGAANVICFGVGAGRIWSKVNRGAPGNSVIGAITAATAINTYLGRFSSAGSSYPGVILEVLFSTQAFTDAWADGVASAVLSRRIK